MRARRGSRAHRGRCVESIDVDVEMSYRDGHGGGADGGAEGAPGGAEGAPRKVLPKLTFKLKRPVAEAEASGDSGGARRGDGDVTGGGQKRRREGGGESEEERKIRELKAKMARLSELLPDGGGTSTSGAVKTKGRAPSGLSRGTAPRAAIFGMVNASGDIERSSTPMEASATPSTSAYVDGDDGDAPAAPVGPILGGQTVSIDPPKVPKEAPVSKKKLEDVLNKLQKLDKTGIFLYPVTEDIAPGYFSVIARPMDFTTLRTRVKNNDYSHFHPFCVDVETMYRNALQYNPPPTEIHQIASKMLEQARRIINKTRGLSPNAGFVKPKKIKPMSTPKVVQNKSAAAAAATPAGADTSSAGELQMFDNSGVDIPDFLHDDDFDLHNDLDENDDFDIGVDSFLHDSFSIESLHDENFGVDALDEQSVNKPQEMLLKPDWSTKRTKRQTFTVRDRGYEFIRLPMIWPGERRKPNLAHAYLPNENAPYLDLYPTSVNSFISLVSDEVKSGPAKAFMDHARLSEPQMVPVPKPAVGRAPHAPSPVAAQALPSSRVIPEPAQAAPAVVQDKHKSENVPWLYEAPSLTEILARGNPNDPSHPPRIKAGIAGFHCMQRARELMTGDRDPSGENPFEKLPSGYMPQGKSMVFTVTVLGSTIAHTLGQRGIFIPPPNPPTTVADADDDEPIDRDDIPLSKLV